MREQGSGAEGEEERESRILNRLHTQRELNPITLRS